MQSLVLFTLAAENVAFIIVVICGIANTRKISELRKRVTELENRKYGVCFVCGIKPRGIRAVRVAHMVEFVSMAMAEFMAATGGTGRHVYLCLRVADGPRYVVRSEIKQCTICGLDVWYDPKCSIYKPGEIITCIPCYMAIRQASGN